MAAVMKKSLSLVLVALLSLALAVPVFAESYNYVFYYDGAYHEHSSSFIAGPAEVEDGQVTIHLNGNYFPDLEVDGITYVGSYNPATGLTAFVFPGDASAPIDVRLHVQAGPHSQYYDLTIVWE